MDTNKKDSDNSPAANSVAPTTGPSLTPPLPKKESEKRADAPKNVNVKGSGRSS